MLSDIKFDIVYTSGENEPVEFFFDALLESINFDLGLGFFSSSAIRTIAPGFAYFVANGGKMRVIINDILSDEDKIAISEGYSIDKNSIEEKFLSNFNYLNKNLSAEGIHFYKCLSHLIAYRKIEFVATIPSHSKGGIVHQKFGIFQDCNGNKIVFSGSSNFSKTAFFDNMETICCYTSWANDNSIQRYILYYQSLFDKIWKNEFPRVEIIPFDKIRTKILDTFPVVNIQELIAENKIIYKNDTKSKLEIPESLLKKIAMIETKPKFPGIPRAYQIDAYNCWVRNNYQGIFAMATGTGKTITSLNCVLEEYNKSQNYRILILVPFLSLLDQWIEEVCKFNYSNIIEVSGRTNWRETLTKLKNDFSFGLEQNFVLISTYDSFPNQVFQNLLSKLPNDIIIIADEAHNIGSNSVRGAFKKLAFPKRIALSATPKRCYDPEGSLAIEQFFNDKEPYCYNFDMERAIKEGYLMRYLYYPRLVFLSSKEMVKYAELTKKLIKYFDGKELKKCPEVEKLLLIRKQIIHKAINKYVTLKNMLLEIKKDRELTFCFIYSPEGNQSGEESDERIIQKMCNVIHETSPETTFNTYLGGDNGRNDTLKSFSEGSTNVLLAMKCLDEGVDVPRAEIGIFASSTGNPRQFIQRRGRLLRKHPDKNFARIYDMIVVPDYTTFVNETDSFKIERSLVKTELTRVAYFASLAENYSESYTELKNICDHYKLSIDLLIKELK
jgi:superfamily II DNA or RNA helicase